MKHESEVEEGNSEKKGEPLEGEEREWVPHVPFNGMNGPYPKNPTSKPSEPAWQVKPHAFIRASFLLHVVDSN